MAFNMEEHLREQNKNNPFKEVDRRDYVREGVSIAAMIGISFSAIFLSAYFAGKSAEYQRERFDIPPIYQILR